MKEHEQELLKIKQRTGNNAMLGVSEKQFKSNKDPYNPKMVYVGTGNMRLTATVGYSINANDSKIITILINKFIEGIESNKDLDQARSFVIPKREIYNMFGIDTKNGEDVASRNLNETGDKLLSIQLSSKDRGAKKSSRGIVGMPILDLFDTLTKRGHVKIKIAPSFAEYILDGHSMYLPKEIFTLTSKYGFLVAYQIYVYQRMNIKKQDGEINIENLINHIPELKEGLKSTHWERVYKHIDDALIEMVEKKVIKSFEYENVKTSDDDFRGQDYYTKHPSYKAYKILKGENIKYKVLDCVAEKYVKKKKIKRNKKK